MHSDGWWYIEAMKKYLFTLLLFLTFWQGGAAQTLGETLQSISDRSQGLAASQQSVDTWGTRTATEDLKELASQASRLLAALSLNDARDVEELESVLRASARRVRTSKVMLPDSVQSEAEEVIGLAEQVGERLTQLRLRFVGKAAGVNGSLADTSLVPDEDWSYAGLQELLIDVRSARELVGTLGTGTVQQFSLTLTGAGPNNLDGLQVRRLYLTAWELERQLSGRVDDVRESLGAWKKFQREYKRLAYPGTGSNVRQLERVMARLTAFYAEL